MLRIIFLFFAMILLIGGEEVEKININFNNPYYINS